MEDGDLAAGLIMHAHLGAHEMGSGRVLGDLEAPALPGHRVLRGDGAVSVVDTKEFKLDGRT